MSITTTDRMLREIEIYKNIFHSQYSKYTPNSGWPYPMILDKDGKDGIDGRYICSVNIYSDVEMFEIQSFKDEIIKRYESTLSHSLLKADLLEIRESATEAIRFYDENLTDEADIVKDFKDKQSSLPIAERMDFVETHQAVITILSYSIGEIYLGAGCGDDVKIGNYRYNYPPVNNYTIAVDCCLQIVEFIDKLEFNFDKRHPDKSVNKRTNKYTQPVCSLLHYFLSIKGEGTVINTTNMDKLAKEYGFDSPTSGIALRNEFVKYQDNTYRLNLSGIKRTDSTKKKNFIKVIEILSERNNLKSLSLANDEYLIFNNKFENQYS
jgi:hypothetical protein